MKEIIVNKTRQRSLPLLALLTVLAAPALWAMPPTVAGPPDPERMLQHLAAELDLSAEQQDEIRAIAQQDSEAQRADRQRLRELREALKDQRSDFDAGSSQALADEMGAITARMTFSATQKQAQIYGLLTDQQQAAYDELQSRREARTARRGGKHGN